MKQETNENIGSLIEKMVRSKQIGITEFADLINCRRENVYNIFKRNSIDIELLARISRVLNYNFFEDVAKNYELAMPTPIDTEEEERRKAICQFLDVVPNILRKYKIRGNIVLAQKEVGEEDIPLPDYIIGPYMFTITFGETIEERLNGKLNGLMHFQKFSDEKGNSVLFCHSDFNQHQSIDIKLDYKSEEEWEAVLLLAMKVADKYYNEVTKSDIRWDLDELKKYD